MAELNPNLISLNGEPVELAEDAVDLRGRGVVDADGEAFGEVEDLLVDKDERRVRLLRVRIGGRIEEGGRIYLVPVDAIEEIHADRVHLDRTRLDVTGGPEYDPDEVARDDAGVWEPFFGHYGVAPFWQTGYAYPLFTPFGQDAPGLRRERGAVAPGRERDPDLDPPHD